MREDSGNYRDILLGDLPLLDLRAPVEFAKGAFPHAVNLPLMSDDERAQVGTCYKQRGQQAAIALGHQLVSGAIKAARIAAWVDFARANPDGYLYCFRGGLRSKISQQWLASEAGVVYPRIAGGYKAMRTFLVETLDAAVADCEFVVLGGLTGTGKTEVLAQLENAIDLERRAHHRGSSFGRHATPQPGQIDFENALAIDFLRQRAAGRRQFVVEDEGSHIGACSVPLALRVGMQQYPVVWLEEETDARVERILADYVTGLCAEFVAVLGAQAGFDAYAERMRANLKNIVRRLGFERYQRLAGIMEAALDEQHRSGAVDLHRDWIGALLSEYYDPMYAYQCRDKTARIEFRGNRQAVTEYIRERARRPAAAAS